MAKWYKIPPTFRVTDREYEANIRGLNIVFGAVLGVVLAGADGLPVHDFVIVLFLSAAVVIQILYLGQSEYRLFYFTTTAVLIIASPLLIHPAIDMTTIKYWQPTLAVWAIMVVFVELLPREKPPKTAKPAAETNETKKDASS